MTRILVTTVLAIVAVCVLLTAKIQAHPAWGIVVDCQGQVYFSDLKTIWKIDAQGKLSVFRAGGDWHTHELNIDEAGNLFGADNFYEPATKRFSGAIWKMIPAGGFSYLLARTENPPQGTSIWKDRDGNMHHFANYPERELLVLKRTPNGKVTALVGSSSSVRNYRQGGPYSAGGTAFGADGALYFTNGADVSKLTTSGAVIALARNIVMKNAAKNSAGGSPLFGIAVDTQGSVFVADYGNRRLLKITPDGQMAPVIRSEESWYPTGVAVRGGELYILEEAHTPTYTSIGTRVRKLSRDGKVSVLAIIGNTANQPVRQTPAAKEPNRLLRRTASLISSDWILYECFCCRIDSVANGQKESRGLFKREKVGYEK